jgi:hypothetical protein
MSAGLAPLQSHDMSQLHWRMLPGFSRRLSLGSRLQMICRDDFSFAVPCRHPSATNKATFPQGEPARRHRGASRHSSFSTIVSTE